MQVPNAEDTQEMPQGTRREGGQDGEEGFLLIAMVVAIFLVLLALSVAAPRMAMQLKRDRELETSHRANQYVRGIRMYFRKFKAYPVSIEALKKSNNQRFLRQEYVDPMTGEKDWNLIRLGQNKTTVKGFFGEELPGLPGGLGSAAGLNSGIGAGSATPGSNGPRGSGGPLPSSPGPSDGTSGASTGPSTSGTGAPGTNSGGGSSPTPGSSQNASTLSGTGGPFIGVGVPKSGDAMLTVNEQATYQDWEFLYDPRIEQMYAKGNLLGGGITSGSATGLGSASSLGQGYGGNNTGGAGQNGNGSGGSAPNNPPNTPPGTSSPR